MTLTRTGFGCAVVLAAVTCWAAPAPEVQLLPADARISGGAQYYNLPQGEFIGGWTDPNALIEWDLVVDEPARPHVVLTYAVAPGNGGDFELTVAGRRLAGKTESTGDWYNWKTMDLGEVDLAAGTHQVRVKAGPFQGAPMNIRVISLSPLKGKAKAPALALPKAVYIVPNFHPASCGWLTNWSTERSYCANTYLDHLDRVRDDPRYGFAISEVNNLIAILNFEPQRFEELKARMKEGRVEPVNAFFLESTINLSGGEALVKMGVEGLRWQQQVLGIRPRLCWAIDVCGTHEQMAQITSGLGLEALVFCRHNPTPSTVFWAESPDGSRVLALSPGHYSDWGEVFGTPAPLNRGQLVGLARDLAGRANPAPLTEEELKRLLTERWAGTPRRTPFGLPVLILGGNGDYALAPACKAYPTAFIEQFREVAPETQVEFTTPGKYLDAILPKIRSGEVRIPTMKGGTGFSFDSFWIQSPRVKQWYRGCEQQLQAAEMLATAASLKAGFKYPVAPLYHAWLQMLLNMDRNTLWGAAGGMVFEHGKSWDAADRFTWVERAADKTLTEAASALGGGGKAAAFFNPLNWTRNDPVALAVEPGDGIRGVVCQTTPDGQSSWCRLDLPPAALVGFTIDRKAAKPSEKIDLPETIETRFYSARIDAATGALVSLRLKPSGREMLGGPANVIVAERTRQPQGDPGDHTAPRDGRDRLGTSSDAKPTLAAFTGPVVTFVEASGPLPGGGRCRRLMRFYADHPRIDFETELTDIADRTVVVAEFPLAEDILEVRRGIPYGFSHGAWSKPNPDLHGWTQGITPAVRWSHYTLAGGGGVAILDRGLTGRELTARTPILFLLNATDKYYGYPNAWLSGKGARTLEYALVAHESPWKEARIPRMAWEFNAGPGYLPWKKDGGVESYLTTSDNVIVEALRREGPDIELRMAECFGYAGEAEVTLNLPHQDARLTDLVGGNAKPLPGGPAYKFPVRPQQIVTMRFRAPAPVEEIQPLLQWDSLVPGPKQEMLRQHTKDKGHPPHG